MEGIHTKLLNFTKIKLHHVKAYKRGQIENRN